MSEENKYELGDMLNAAALQQPVEFQNAFNDILLNRINTAVENRKVEIAQTLYNPPEDFETDNDDEFGTGDIDLENSEEENDG